LAYSLLNRRYRRRRTSLMHTITECRAERNYTLWLRFDDGLEGSVSLGDLVLTESYLAISDEETFSRVEIDPVSNAVTWGGGINLDPEMLYRDLANRTFAARH
jgi:Protein of unknown function (DUF2442)